MDKVIVSGHKNPDTDSICSAIAMAELKKAQGVNAQAVRLGTISNETKFILDYFKVSAPLEISDFSKEAKEVILVDHNEFSQSGEGINDVRILEVVDHHRIADFITAYPLYYRSEPVGCTSTIITKMYLEQNIPIKKEVAGLMLSAIISDTLLFKSPTCTGEDKEKALYLASLIDIDVNVYGIELLKAGASIKGKSASELINVDSKPFAFGSYRFEVAQINVVDIEEVLLMKNDFISAMNEAMLLKEQDVFFTIITDVLNNNSKGFVVGDVSIIEKAFDAQVIDSVIDLPGIVSRKKQVIPFVSKACQL